MPASTTIYAFQKPTVGGDADVWGGAAGLNGNIDDMDVLFASIATTGSSNAYVLTSGLSLAAYVTGQTFRIRPNFTNSGAATINVDGLGARNLTKQGATALASGDLTSGRVYTITYDGTQFQVMELVGFGALANYQPLDGDLTAIAALGNGVPERTGTDTWSARTDVVRTSVANTFTAAQTISNVSVPLILTAASASVTVRINGASAQSSDIDYQVAGSSRWQVGRGTGDGSNDFVWYNAGTAAAGMRLSYTGNNLTLVGTGTGTDWVSTSDRRLKDNITPITDHWPIVEALAQSASRFDKSGRRHIGLIAQDFQEIAPELVLEGDDGYLAMPAGSPYAAILAKAVMDLTARIAALEARNA